jgi:hypothetical protein
MLSLSSAGVSPGVSPASRRRVRTASRRSMLAENPENPENPARRPVNPPARRRRDACATGLYESLIRSRFELFQIIGQELCYFLELRHILGVDLH